MKSTNIKISSSTYEDVKKAFGEYEKKLERMKALRRFRDSLAEQEHYQDDNAGLFLLNKYSNEELVIDRVLAREIRRLLEERFKKLFLEAHE